MEMRMFSGTVGSIITVLEEKKAGRFFFQDASISPNREIWDGIRWLVGSFVCFDFSH